jgi:hypothetical protein
LRCWPCTGELKAQPYLPYAHPDSAFEAEET